MACICTSVPLFTSLCFCTVHIRILPKEVHNDRHSHSQEREWYARRKDKLASKRRFYDGPALARSVEVYNAGAAYGIRELHHHYGVNEAGESVVARRVGHYYTAARLEGLTFKDEQARFAAVITWL